MVLDAVKTRERHAEWAQRAADFLIKTQTAVRPLGLPRQGPRPLELAVRGVRALRGDAHGRRRAARASSLRFANGARSRCRATDGGFPYAHDAMVTGSMTAAGTASLLLCRQLGEKQKAALPERIDAAAEKGLELARAAVPRRPQPERPGRRIPAEPRVLVLLPLRGRARGRPRRPPEARRPRLVPRGRDDAHPAAERGRTLGRRREHVVRAPLPQAREPHLFASREGVRRTIRSSCSRSRTTPRRRDRALAELKIAGAGPVPALLGHARAVPEPRRQAARRGPRSRRRRSSPSRRCAPASSSGRSSQSPKDFVDLDAAIGSRTTSSATRAATSGPTPTRTRSSGSAATRARRSCSTARPCSTSTATTRPAPMPRASASS